MHKKFEINPTKFKGGCQSGRKVVTHNSKRDLPLEMTIHGKLFFYYKQLPDIHDLAEFPTEDQDKPKDPPKDPHESFLAKKAKYDEKAATQTFLDLKLLKRKNPEDENLEENDDGEDDDEENETETAVLKVPPNLDSKKPNETVLIDEDAQETKNNLAPAADYEEDFPNDKEKRGMYCLSHNFLSFCK